MKRLTLLIVSLIAAWLTVVIFKPDIEARFSSWGLRHANRVSGRPDNPLYEEMRRVAAPYGLDVSFVREATRNRWSDLASAELFTKPPGYYDVIIFGDSSLSWSFSPQLVSQISNRKVAFLGFESALPNKSLVAVAEQISDVYLKKHGLAVFLFDFWFVDPLEPQRTGDMLRLTRQSDASVLRQELERAVDAELGLPRLSVYADAVEPFFAPGRYREKHFGAQGMGCAFYSWGARSGATFLHCRADDGEPDPVTAHVVTLAGTLVDNCAGVSDGNTAANMKAIAQSRIANKVIAVPFSDHPSTALFCEAARLKGYARVLDLPRLAVEKYQITTLEFQGETHLANTASIPASVVLGKALAELAR